MSQPFPAHCVVGGRCPHCSHRLRARHRLRTHPGVLLMGIPYHYLQPTIKRQREVSGLELWNAATCAYVRLPSSARRTVRRSCLRDVLSSAERASPAAAAWCALMLLAQAAGRPVYVRGACVCVPASSAGRAHRAYGAFVHMSTKTGKSEIYLRLPDSYATRKKRLRAA